jgi:hypothetical protein
VAAEVAPGAGPIERVGLTISPVGLPPGLSFFRDRKGSEVDLVIEDSGSLIAVETKSGQTIASDFFAGLESFRALAAESLPSRPSEAFLVYSGAETQKRSAAEVVSWVDLDRFRWWDSGAWIPKDVFSP